MEMEMEGIEMDDALPQKRQKKNYRYTCTCTCTCTCQSCSLANQLNTNISCHHHQGCVNEVMIEFFRSHFCCCCWWVSLLHRPDLFHSIIIHPSVPQI